jgi:tRNA(Ile)-lysidine synthase
MPRLIRMTSEAEGLKDRLKAALTDFPRLEAVIQDFGDRLRPHSDYPVMIGVSGGGDSVALLLLLWVWGRRRLIVGHVDHDLQVQSAQWAQGVAGLCTQIGVQYIGLKWANPASGAGISRAARLARHRLLAEAARGEGASVICLGQNHDDALEAQWMRAQGSSVGEAQVWAPSPVWPEGRGLFLYRPLTGIARKDLRDWLKASGVAYIDDPANANPKSLRARARLALGETQAVEKRPADTDLLTPSLFAALEYAQPDFGAFGAIALKRPEFLKLTPENGQKILKAGLVCAGGGESLPDATRVASVYETVRTLDKSKRTLAGARLLVNEARILMCRDATDRRGRPQPERIQLAAGETLVWDGRFEIRALKPLVVASHQGAGLMRSKALSQTARACLKTMPSDIRQGLPVAVTVMEADLPQDGLNPYALWEGNEGIAAVAQVRSLCTERFKAALGLWPKEA